MIKTVAALMALVVGGFAGAVLTEDTNAQRIDVNDEKTVILEIEELTTSNSAGEWFQRSPMHLQMINGQRGGWEIREVNDWVMLFNPASGETFYLEDDDDGIFWKPIERRGGPDRREGRRGDDRDNRRDDDRREGRGDDRRSRREKLERYLDELEEQLSELKEKLEDADGKHRKKIERALKEKVEELKKIRRKIKGGR